MSPKNLEDDGFVIEFRNISFSKSINLYSDFSGIKKNSRVLYVSFLSLSNNASFVIEIIFYSVKLLSSHSGMSYVH